MSLPFRIVKLASPPDQVKAAVLSGDLVPYYKQSGIFTLGGAARYMKWSDQSDGSLLGKLGYFRSKNQCIYRFRMIFVPRDTGTELTLKVEHGPFSLILKFLLYVIGLCLCVVGVVFSFIGSSMIKRGQNYLLQYLQGHLVDWDQARNSPTQSAASAELIPSPVPSDLLENISGGVPLREESGRPVSLGTPIYPPELPSPGETSSVPVVDTGVGKGNSAAQNPSPPVTDPLKNENELDPDPTRQKSPIPLVIGVIAVLVIAIYAVFHFTGNSQRVEQKWTSGSVAAKAVPNASTNETLPPVQEKSSKNSPFSVSPDGRYSVEVIPHPEEGSMLLVKKNGKCIFEEPGMNYLLDVQWSPGGKYVAFNERRGNSGDYLWILDLEKKKALKSPEDNLWKKMESQCTSSLTEVARRKWGADVEGYKDWGIADSWEDEETLVAKVTIQFNGGSMSRTDNPRLEALVNLKISNGSVFLQSEKPSDAEVVGKNLVEESYGIVYDRGKNELIVKFAWTARFGASRFRANLDALDFLEARSNPPAERGAFRGCAAVVIPVKPGHQVDAQFWNSTTTADHWNWETPPDEARLETEELVIHMKRGADVQRLIDELKGLAGKARVEKTAGMPLAENIAEEGGEQNEPPSIPEVPQEKQRLVDNPAIIMPGERFPETRQKLLNYADLTKMTDADLRYAINEMFARHGGTFGKQVIRQMFEKFNWYRPRACVDFDHIEQMDFTNIEKANVKLLGAARDSKPGGAPE